MSKLSRSIQIKATMISIIVIDSVDKNSKDSNHRKNSEQKINIISIIQIISDKQHNKIDTYVFHTHNHDKS